MKNFIAPPGYDEPDRVEGYEPNRRWVGCLASGMIAFWAAVIGGCIYFFN